MTLRFAYTRLDGGVSIVSAAPKDQIEKTTGPLTDDAYRALVLFKGIPPDVTDVHELPESGGEPDTDRAFRNAWRLGPTGLVIDMTHAREIHRDKMRLVRKPMMAALDVEFMKAIEQATPLDTIATQKQTLRDVTADPAIESAQTPLELKAVWPTILKGETP